MTTKQAREQVKSRIGDLIRDNLELCGLTSRDLIDELGIQHAHLSAWLTGRHLPSLPAALAMAQVSMMDLVDEPQNEQFSIL